jgi:hypothetical protein
MNGYIGCREKGHGGLQKSVDSFVSETRPKAGFFFPTSHLKTVMEGTWHNRENEEKRRILQPRYTVRERIWEGYEREREG